VDSQILKLRKIVLNVAKHHIDLGPDDSLRENGITSMNVVLILAGIERAFAIELPAEELTEENFRTLRTISSMIDRVKRNGA
jgi:acyl carrier protein